VCRARAGDFAWPSCALPPQEITCQFLKSGRYLVICMNRVHFLNDWMFGFVNVKGGDGER
jgi:hypothetical protein